LNITFKPVDEGDIEFLYNLFSERTKYPEEIRFEKKDIPLYEEHTAFVERFLKRDHEYQSWYIILYDNEKVGSLVLKKDGEWGYHVLMKHWGKMIGQTALDWLIKQHPDKTLIANIKVENKKAQHIAEKFGHVLVSYTYRREPTNTTKDIPNKE